MATDPSPTVRRLRLGIELRQIRHRSGVTMLEAADHVSRTDSAISRMETGQVAMSLRVLDKLLTLYEATDEEREALRRLAKEGRKRGWWHAYGEVLPQGFDVYLGLESEATSHWIYEPEVVPGLMQTEGYARAVFHAEPFPASDEEVSARIAVRMERQRRLAGEDGPALWPILHEGVLRHVVGGRSAMAEQLDHLLALSRQRNVTLQVIPFSAGAHPSMHCGGFTVLSIPLGNDITYDLTYLEHRTGSLYLDRTGEVETHKLIFEHLRAKALDREDSRALISEIRRAMTSE